MLSEESPALPLRIGCPVWNCDAWTEEVYPARTPQRDKLRWYTRMFNTVEGNNSFYAIPAEEHAERWANVSAEGFQFCMKFPREISHERELVQAEVATQSFLRVLYILAEKGRAGPAFLQLGPEFSPKRFGILESYLQSLPKDLAWAVEVRHLDWFDEGPNERRLHDLLASLGIDQTLFDSRPLYQSEPDDEIERVSQTRKPKSPFRSSVTGQRPMLRIVGRNRVDLTLRFIDEWVPIVAKWIAQGLEPIIFTHAPDDRFAPEFARTFYSRLMQHEAFPRSFIPVGGSELPKLPSKPQQLGFAFE